MGCALPVSGLPGGNAAAKPLTQRARSVTQLKIPPIGANAPAGSNATSAHPSGVRRYPRAVPADPVTRSPGVSNSSASYPVRIMPSGWSRRWRT